MGRFIDRMKDTFDGSRIKNFGQKIADSKIGNFVEKVGKFAIDMTPIGMAVDFVKTCKSDGFKGACSGFVDRVKTVAKMAYELSPIASAVEFGKACASGDWKGALQSAGMVAMGCLPVGAAAGTMAKAGTKGAMKAGKEGGEMIAKHGDDAAGGLKKTGNDMKSAKDEKAEKAEKDEKDEKDEKAEMAEKAEMSGKASLKQVIAAFDYSNSAKAKPPVDKKDLAIS